jgi:hypothetical protein
MESDNIVSSRIIDDEDTMFDAPQKKHKTTSKIKQSDDTKRDHVSEIIHDASGVLEELEKNNSGEQVESRDIGHLANANQEIDNNHMEIDISLKGEFSSCSEIEKDTKMDLSGCVEDVSQFFFHFFI